MRTKAVDLAKATVRKVAVPDLVGTFGQIKASDFATSCWVEQAKFDAFGVCGEHREICAQAVPGGAQRIRCAPV
jgi:hypothetical protein